MRFGRMLWSIALAACIVGQAHSREVAPDFTARALSGETFTKGSVHGSIVLLQFWTTWCPVCREDQAAVDSISAEFAGQGLVVLAVNVREAEMTVRQYLAGRPRSCPVVLTQDTDLVAKYNPRSFPQYVLFDREGNVAATQSGGGGEASLLHLLRRAGLKRGGATELADENPKNGPSNQTIAPGKMIVLSEARPAQPVAATAPKAATVFVMASGERVETHQFVLTAESVSVTVDGLRRSIPMSEVDLKATRAANRERGIELKIPSRHEVFLGR